MVNALFNYANSGQLTQLVPRCFRKIANRWGLFVTLWRTTGLFWTQCWNNVIFRVQPWRKTHVDHTLVKFLRASWVLGGSTHYRCNTPQRPHPEPAWAWHGFMNEARSMGVSKNYTVPRLRDVVITLLPPKISDRLWKPARLFIFILPFGLIFFMVEKDSRGAARSLFDNGRAQEHKRTDITPE